MPLQQLTPTGCSTVSGTRDGIKLYRFEGSVPQDHSHLGISSKSSVTLLSWGIFMTLSSEFDETLSPKRPKKIFFLMKLFLSCQFCYDGYNSRVTKWVSCIGHGVGSWVLVQSPCACSRYPVPVAHPWLPWPSACWTCARRCQCHYCPLSWPLVSLPRGV